MARHQCDVRCRSWRVNHCGWCGEPLVGAFSPKHDGCQERWRQGQARVPMAVQNRGEEGR